MVESDESMVTREIAAATLQRFERNYREQLDVLSATVDQLFSADDTAPPIYIIIVKIRRTPDLGEGGWWSESLPAVDAGGNPIPGLMVRVLLQLEGFVITGGGIDSL